MAILPAADIERAKRFYGETLALPQADIPGANSAWFKDPEGNILAINQLPVPLP